MNESAMEFRMSRLRRVGLLVAALWSAALTVYLVFDRGYYDYRVAPLAVLTLILGLGVLSSHRTRVVFEGSRIVVCRLIPWSQTFHVDDLGGFECTMREFKGTVYEQWRLFDKTRSTVAVLRDMQDPVALRRALLARIPEIRRSGRNG